MNINCIVFCLLLHLSIAAVYRRQETYRSLYPRLPIREGAVLPERPDGHIINGTPADPHEYPWQVGMFIDTHYFCGGTLIARTWVLTAAHCLHKFHNVEIILGAVSISKNEDSKSSVFSKRLIPHKEFDPFWLDYDIGLVELPFPVIYNEYQFSIPLPTNSPAIGTDVIVTGWGMTSDEDHGLNDLAEELMELETVIIKNKICASYFLHPHWDQNHCLDGSGGIGSCSGDSGGPMVFEKGGTLVLGGICSFGSPTGCEQGAPSVYSNVVYYLDWITEQTGMIFDK